MQAKKRVQYHMSLKTVLKLFQNFFDGEKGRAPGFLGIASYNPETKKLHET